MKKIHNHALHPDKNTMEQFEHCAIQNFVEEAALMPDAHSGYVAPIGSVLLAKDHVVPSWVGYDIGCGMTSVQLHAPEILEKIKLHADSIYAEVQKVIPMGMGRINEKKNVSEDTQEKYQLLVNKFAEGPHDKNVLQFLQSKAVRHLGSLGDGNHFVEIGYHENEAWITVHSGSRGVGYKIAERYMQKSSGKKVGFEATHPLDINSALGKEYLNVLDFGLEFALLNRLEMIKKTVAAISKVLNEEVGHKLWVNKNHNHAIEHNGMYIHRKGATPAKKGERGVIPANMRDGCFLVEGLGNPEFLESSSHGAGRVLSRKAAKEKFTMEQFQESMEGIVGTITEGTLDEAPMAYKNIYDVMEAQKESVRVVKQLVPIINWKGEKGRKKVKTAEEIDK